jgi:mono/diheme cytochrome c family protein
MTTRWLLRATTLALVLALAGCTRRNGSHTEPPAANEPTPVSTGRPSQIETGQALYQKYCKLCHAADGTGYAADNAPSLVSHHFLRSATDDFIAHGIRMGRPNTAMAAYGASRGGPLSEPEIDAIVAFLRSKGPHPTPLPETPLRGDVGRGRLLFTEHCQECHGDASQRGNAVSLHNPEFLTHARPAFFRAVPPHRCLPSRASFRASR